LLGYPSRTDISDIPVTTAPQEEDAEVVRALIVDDNADIRWLLRLQLENAGFTEVDEAADGADAIERVEDFRPEVVLMDLMMPVLDGIEATQRIKGSHPDIHVIGFTSLGEIGQHAPLIEAGATEVFDKTHHQELLEYLERLSAELKAKPAANIA
jgi:phosphoserine phosphatase RsbU/P